jgi:hypothetical protein
MADLKENAITKLSSTAIADMSLDAPTLYSLFTCPPGKQLLVDHVVVHSNSASLAGMTDVNFGGGVAAITPVWADAADFSSMVTANSRLVLRTDTTVVIIDGDDATALDRTFRMEVIAGATAAGTGVIDVFGYLIDS